MFDPSWVRNPHFPDSLSRLAWERTWSSWLIASTGWPISGSLSMNGYLDDGHSAYFILITPWIVSFAFVFFEKSELIKPDSTNVFNGKKIVHAFVTSLVFFFFYLSPASALPSKKLLHLKLWLKGFPRKFYCF